MQPIKTITDVTAFVHHIINDLDVNFNPDDDFSQYINALGQPTFTAVEVEQMNQALAEAFAVCELAGEDLYALTLPILRQRLGLAEEAEVA